ncbi:MAG: sulfatase-like hydrolase/transferase [Verrucomicrobiota bacterium]
MNFKYAFILLLIMSPSYQNIAQDLTQSRTPNIVFLLVDDLGWSDVGYQSGRFHTPHIDQLASEGAVFSNAYATSPVCSPSRASIITGKYPTRLGINSHIPSLHKSWQNGRPPGGQEYSTESGLPTRNWLPKDQPSLARALKSHDYYTGFIGKWHLGHEPFYPQQHGFDWQMGITNFGQPPSYYAPYERERYDEILRIEELATDARPEEYLWHPETGIEQFLDLSIDPEEINDLSRVSEEKKRIEL